MRRLLPLAGVVGAVLVLAAGPAARPVSAGPDCLRTVAGAIDLQAATIPELQAAMAARRLTSVALVDAYQARIEAFDRAGAKLNSIRELATSARGQALALDAERAAGQVRGPLHGIPVLLKDNTATADLPLTAGAISLEGARPVRDATLAARLRAAGAVILGKANLSEFAGWVDLDAPPGWSSLAGQVVNANDPTYGPSGSSAGSGVAASMAFAAGAIGTETSGSILSPSDANGVVGVKTTLGIASRAGILPLAPSFDVPGPMVRTVTDAALVLGAIAGPDERDPATATAVLPPGGDFTAGLKADAVKGKRFAYSASAHDGLNDERRALFDAALERLVQLGAETVAVQSFDSENVGLTEIATIPNEFKGSLNQFLVQELPGAAVHTLGEIVAFNNAHSDRYPYGQNLLEASEASPGVVEVFPAFSEPVHAGSPASIDGALAEAGADAILTPGNAHANIGAAAGYPTVIVPMGYTLGGLRPFGLGFLGRAYEEPALLGYAFAFEQSARARVAPTDVNVTLVPASCPTPGAQGPAPPASIPAPAALARLRVTLRRRGRALAVTVRGARGARVRITVRRGRRIVARRSARVRAGTARLRVRARRPGRYSVTVLDPGPPPRTARSHVRLRRRG